MSITYPFEDPRDVLRRHGLFAKRRFSQNFLTDPSVVDGIVRALGPLEGRPVVELGPGLGTLTSALLSEGAEVLAVERDRDMLAVLRDEFDGDPRLRLFEGDAATFDLGAHASEVGAAPLVVGNLPYAITGAISRNLVAHADAISAAVVMVQREVAHRWSAAPGIKAYGAATVFVTAAYRVAPVFDVPSGSFHPAPKVDSAIVRLDPLRPRRALETEAFRRVVTAAFGQRRKTLRNALKPIADTARVDAAIAEIGVAAGVRGETLTVEQFAALAEALLG